MALDNGCGGLEQAVRDGAVQESSVRGILHRPIISQLTSRTKLITTNSCLNNAKDVPSVTFACMPWQNKRKTI